MCVHLVVSQCTTGFTEESSLSSINLARSQTRAGYQLLFLFVNFSCVAQITRFVISALRNPDISGQSTQYPYIQIYRPGPSNTYNRVYTIGAITEEVTSIGNITDSTTGNIITDASLYEYTPINQTITVLPNDVLGMFVIPQGSGYPRTQIMPYFIEVQNAQYVEIPVTASSNISNIFAGSNLQIQFSPLIAVYISKLLFSNTLYIMSLLVVLSSTPSPSMTSSDVVIATSTEFSITIPSTTVHEMPSTTVHEMPSTTVQLIYVLMSSNIAVSSTSNQTATDVVTSTLPTSTISPTVIDVPTTTALLVSMGVIVSVVVPVIIILICIIICIAVKYKKTKQKLKLYELDVRSRNIIETENCLYYVTNFQENVAYITRP